MQAEHEFFEAMRGVFVGGVAYHNGRVFPQASLYQQVVEAVAGYEGIEARKGATGSKPPIWTAGWDWVRDVDRTLQEWTPHLGREASPTIRADHLRVYAPFHSAVEIQYTTEIVHAWWRSGFTLLHDRSSLDLRAACPACDVDFVMVKDALGETVRREALRVSVFGASCESCKRIWYKDELVDLAKDLRTLEVA